MTELGNGHQLVTAAIVVLALSLLLQLLRALKSKLRTAGTLRFPLGPPAWPILGHLPLLRTRPHQVLAELSMKQGYGPIIGLRLGSHRAVVVSNSVFARELLLTHDKAFANRVPYLFTNTLLFGYDSAVVFSSHNPRWTGLRKIYTLELLTAKRLHELRHVRQEELRSLLHRLCEASRGGTHAVDIGTFLAEMSANTIARMVLSKTLVEVAPELPGLIRALELEAFPTLGDFLPSLKFMDALPKRRMKLLHDRIDKIFDFIIHERRQLMKMVSPHELPNDFLQVVISKETSSDDKGLILATKELKGVMMDMFAAGIHTSTSTLEWAIARLLQNPKCLHKIYEEVDLVTKTDIVSDEDIQQMPYLKNSVKEVLRLNPVIPLLLPRMSSIDCKLGDYTLPKGTQAFVNVWAIGRDPLLWDKPEEFYPERFEGRDLDMRGQNYELLPFGAGRRVCPGIRLGILVVQVTLANLVKFFDLELPCGQSPSSIDMSEKSGFGASKALPMLVIPKVKDALPL